MIVSFIVMGIALCFLLKFVFDSFKIKNKLEILHGETSSQRRLLNLQILFSIIGAVLFSLLEYFSLQVNIYWAIYVLLTIIFFVTIRGYDVNNGALLVSRNVDRIQDYVSYLLGLYYKTRFYSLAGWLLFGNVFIACAILLGKRFPVEWEWYDLPGLYLFYIGTGIIIWSILTFAGFIEVKGKK